VPEEKNTLKKNMFPKIKIETYIAGSRVSGAVNPLSPSGFKGPNIISNKFCNYLTYHAVLNLQ
jgi:hypothetical protein